MSADMDLPRREGPASTDQLGRELTGDQRRVVGPSLALVALVTCLWIHFLRPHQVGYTADHQEADARSIGSDLLLLEAKQGAGRTASFHLNANDLLFFCEHGSE